MHCTVTRIYIDGLNAGFIAQHHRSGRTSISEALLHFAPREIEEEGGVNAENVRELNDARPDAGTIARMMRELGDWVVKNHSNKFYKKNSAEYIIRRLEEIRCSEALSYNEIENRTGLNRGLMKRYLTLEVMPSLDKACKIAEALGYKLQLIADD